VTRSASEQRLGLPDTNTVILLPRITDPEQLPDEPAISTITLAELSVGPLVARTDAERSARLALRLAHVQQAEADFDPIGFDVAAAQHQRVGHRRDPPTPTRTADRSPFAGDDSVGAVSVARSAVGNGI
jgi:hypothetical protein